MPDPQTTILVVVALATLVLPGAFLLVLFGAVLRRRMGHEPGPAWGGAIAFLGGASLGTMFLFADDVLVGAPIALVAVGVAFGQWRAGRRTLAELLVLGATLPWTLLWAANMVLFSRGLVILEPAEAVVAFMAGAVPSALALVALLRDRAEAAPAALGGGEPGEAAPGGEATRGDAGPVAGEPEPTIGDAALPSRFGRQGPRVMRSFHTVGQAIREPSRLGPFGLPEVAALIALVASELALTALVALGLPVIAGYALAIFAGSAIATEAYLRAMAPRTRRSMEAFMWLGSWDLAQVRASTGAGVPTTRGGAAEWLARRPEKPGESPAVGSLRVELNLMAGRPAAARAIVEHLPDATPIERFHKAASADVVAWWTHHGDALDAMAEALPEIEPADGDDRLRAEVALAIARVRHLVVASPAVAEPLAPLLAVRDHLGARADGLVRRILWPRLYRVFVLTAIVLAVAGAATGVSAPLF